MFSCGDVVEIRPIDARYVGMPAFVALFDGGKYAHRICDISYGTIATVIGLSVSQTGDPRTISRFSICSSRTARSW